MVRNFHYRLIVLLLLAILLAGCVGLVPSPFRPSPGPQARPYVQDLAEAFEIVCRNYRLGPGDAIRVLMQTEWSIPAGTYKLDTLDQIRIKFILDPQLNEDVTIRPDGMITVQAIGEIKAAALPLKNLPRKLKKSSLRPIFSVNRK